MSKFLIQLLGGRSISFNTGYLKLGMSVNAALFLGQAVYWSDKTKDGQGWFYKRQADWLYEIGLTRSEQEGARRQLVKLGVLEECLKGLPATMHFRVNFERLGQLILQYAEKQQTSMEGQICDGEYAENQQTGAGKTSKPVSAKDADRCEENTQTFSIHKITTENTTEITSNDLTPAAQAEKPKAKKAATKSPKATAPVYNFDRWPTQPGSEAFANWLKHRKELNKKVTQGAIDGLGRHLHAAAQMLGWTVDECLNYGREANWAGFDPRWVKNREGWGNYRGEALNAPRGAAGGSGVRSTRDRPIALDLTDRSWAEPAPVTPPQNARDWAADLLADDSGRSAFSSDNLNNK